MRYFSSLMAGQMMKYGIIIFIRMSLKDFEIGAKLGKSEITQVREPTRRFSKWSGWQISKCTP